MAIEDDVLVVGGGLAGMVAAITASRAGARTRLVSYKENTLRNASGLIDVLGYLPGGDGPVVDPFAAIPDLPAGHPYRRVGVDTVREGIELFDGLVGDLYRGAHTDANALAPTHGGTVKPTNRYPTSVAAGLASDARDALLVGFETVPDFDAPLAAEHLAAAGVPFETRGVTISFPGEFRADAALSRLAHALDEDEAMAIGERRAGAREALAERVKPHLDGEDRVGFPALLGEEDHDAVREELTAELGADVFEVPMGPPSIPGIRLEDRLRAELAREGVRVEAGNPAVGYEPAGEGIDAVLLDRHGTEVPYGASAVVLATGGLVGKGIDSSRAGVREPIFGCHVPHPEDRYEWFRDGVYDDQPFARFGVRVDDELRPLDESGDPEFANLWAAGAVLGGYDFAREKSGSGVSIATGLVAGRRAAERV